jgi:PAS domain S-box-containing protein
MTRPNTSDIQPSRVSAYLLATLAALVATALRWAIDPWLGESLALVTLPAAVAVGVWLGGYGPALVAAVLGYLAADYLFIGGPRVSLDEPARLIGSLAYLASCGIIIGFGEAMRWARLEAKRRTEMLWTTLGSIGDGVITTDSEGRVTYLNAVAEALVGWSCIDAAGRPLESIFRIVNEATRRAVENPATRALRDGAIVGLANHTILIARDGTERPIDDSAAPVRDERGRLTGCVLVFRDITERRQAERAVERSERELADFFENANIGLHWVGPDGTVLRANRAELALLGYDHDEYVGRPIADFHVDRDVIDDIRARLLAGDSLSEYPARMRCRDGSIKDVLINSTGLWENGVFVHSRCFTLDVTDRKRAEETRALLAAIVETSSDAIVSKTLDGRITSWNAGAELIFGYSAEEAVGRSIDMIVPFEQRDEERSLLERLRRGERVSHVETTRVAKDGRRVDVSLAISPVRDDQGRVIGASKVSRDITERKRAETALRESEEALREADRRKDEFLATLAHELRDPLAPISNALEILARAGHDRERLEQARDTIERQVSHLVRLVDDLLDVGRITHNRLELRTTRVDLAALLGQIADTHRPFAERAGQRLEVVLPAQPVYVDGDSVRLTQVFGNLLGNACRYTPPGGTIRLELASHTGRAAVSVRDTGIGIPADELERVFEMFERVRDDTSHVAPGGLGIGLTLAKQLVELHGGTIEARSEGRRRGSEFIVRVPPAAPAAETAVHEAAAPEPASAVTRRILVVDDNCDSAESLAALLRLTGHEARIAHDGLAAVVAAEEFRPDVVLLDLGLPRLSGIEACRRIREQAWGRSMRIVALTGWGQGEDRRRSREAGFDEHVVKPVSHDALMALLASPSAASTVDRPGG